MIDKALMLETLRNLLTEVSQSNPFADTLLHVHGSEDREHVTAILSELIERYNTAIMRRRASTGGRKGRGVKRPSNAANAARARAALTPEQRLEAMAKARAVLAEMRAMKKCRAEQSSDGTETP